MATTALEPSRAGTHRAAAAATTVEQVSHAATSKQVSRSGPAGLDREDADGLRGRLERCGTEEMMRPGPCPPACHLFGLARKT